MGARPSSQPRSSDSSNFRGRGTSIGTAMTRGRGGPSFQRGDSAGRGRRGPSRGGFSERGRGRGGFTDRGRGRGGFTDRGRGSGGPRSANNPQRRGAAMAESSDDDTQGDLEEEPFMAPTNYDILTEENEADFASLEEARHYAQVMDWMEHYYEENEHPMDVLEREKLKGKMAADAEAQRAIDLVEKMEFVDDKMETLNAQELNPEEVRDYYAQLYEDDESGKMVAPKLATMDAMREALHGIEVPTYDIGEMSEEDVADVFEAEKKVEDDSTDLSIRDAMNHLIETDERSTPRHSPVHSDQQIADRGSIGDIAVGSQSTANVLEDDLRYLAKREGAEWQDPRELALKLIQGELVKFRDVPEKREVLKLAEEMGYTPGQEPGTENIGFEEVDGAARKALVKRLVAGQYKDANDAKVTGKYAQGVARLLGGNATYRAEGKQQLLKTIMELMPEDGQAGRRQARR